MSLVAVESKFDGSRPVNPKFVIVLDKSGSMSDIRDAILRSVNDLIDEQKALSEKLNDDATLTIITFSSESQTVMKNVPFRSARHLEREEYETDGYTALYDAVGVGITQHEGEKNVVFVIVTDGEENSSKHWTHQRVNDAIEAKKAIGWNFIYLANDLRVAEAGMDMGIAAAAACAATSQTNNLAVGYDNMAAALSRQVSGAFAAYRQSSEVPNLNMPPTPPARSVADGADVADVANDEPFPDRLPTLDRGMRSSFQKIDADLDLLTPNVVRTSSVIGTVSGTVGTVGEGDDLDFLVQHPLL